MNLAIATPLSEPPPTVTEPRGLTVQIPADVHTLDGFLDWAASDEFPKQGRIDFINGRLFIDMAAEEINSHVKLKQAVLRGLDNFAHEQNCGEILADGVRFANTESSSGTEPDGMFCSFESIETGRVRYIEIQPGRGRVMAVQGRPDIIVEVISNSSVSKDNRELRQSHFAAGVREYWIFDARGMRLSFDLLTRNEHDWVEAAPDADGFRLSPVLQRRVRIDRGTTRVGTVCYDLRLRE